MMSMQTGRISFAKPLRVCQNLYVYVTAAIGLDRPWNSCSTPYTCPLNRILRLHLPYLAMPRRLSFHVVDNFIFFCRLECKLRQCCQNCKFIQHPLWDISETASQGFFHFFVTPQTRLCSFIIIFEMNRWFSMRFCHVITHFTNLQIVRLDYSESAPSFS
jgi:hypothetical protein